MAARTLESRDTTNTSCKARHYSWLQQTWKPSILLCIFAVAVSTGVSYLLKHHPLHLQRSLLPFHHPISNMETETQPTLSSHPFNRSLLWMAPFFSGGGYSSEAIAYVTALKESGLPRLAIRHHGDAESVRFWKGLPLSTRKTLASMASVVLDVRDAVVVCHSEPGAWHPPLYITPPCPPNGYQETLYVVGRTMFETDSVTPHHVERCNRMDEVWVPSQFHVETFTRAGVGKEKLVKVVQPVDTRFFNPDQLLPLSLPTTNRLFGSDPTDPTPSSPPFIFLSIFKWEHRKGWDILLTAYLQEFSSSDNVALYLLTNPYHSDRDFATAITAFISSRSIREPPTGYAKVFLMDEHVQQAQLPALYKAADCFVLPSRGEGWGRPHVEAMAMALPVIATNWSGMTEYMGEENSYPLRVERMVAVAEGPFQGQLWAEPSGSHLRALMRHVVENREEAREKGQVARADMVEKYGMEVVARRVVAQLARIQAKLDSRSGNTSVA